MDIDEFLQGTAGRVGYMVAVRGRHAPTFVHVGETADAARTAAITEAKRLLHMDGCGRALVLRIEAVVDQRSAVLPKPDVRNVRPLVVEMPFDAVAKIGLKLAKISELEAKLAGHLPNSGKVDPVTERLFEAAYAEAYPRPDQTAEDDPDFREVEPMRAGDPAEAAAHAFSTAATAAQAADPTKDLLRPALGTQAFALRRIIIDENGLVTKNLDGPTGNPASDAEIKAAEADARRVAGILSGRSWPTPAPLVVREHGIYQCRDGKIVGPVRMGAFGPTVDGQIYHPTGEVLRGSSRPADLVREIVVGEGWKPWNGGVKIASSAGEKVDIVTREYVTNGGTTVRNCAAFALRWHHEGQPDDILAYREVSNADEPPFKPGDAVMISDAPGHRHDAIVSMCTKDVTGWRVHLVGGWWRHSTRVSLAPREA